MLKNLLGLRKQAMLERVEAILSGARAEEELPSGRLGAAHYRAIHRHLFQDVYRWAGKYRTVRMAKSGSAFCYPENIPREMNILFAGLRQESFLRGLDHSDFVTKAAHFLSTLNAIHPFREGNGRAQMTYFTLLAERANHPLQLERLIPPAFLTAMVESFKGDTTTLEAQLLLLTA